MTRDEIKSFWNERAKTTNLPRMESQVNFEQDKKIADLRVQAEVALIENKLNLDQGDCVVDLGAGNGRFSLLFAPKVQNVVAVEYVKDFADAIECQAKELQLKNIEIINMPAEDFCRENYANVVFVSGLLHYLDAEQYQKTITNIKKTIKPEGILFLREPISVLENEFIVDKFSEELGTHYCSIYRTSEQHINSFAEQGFHMEEHAPFFDDNSILNKRIETRQYYFIFRSN